VKEDESGEEQEGRGRRRQRGREELRTGGGGDTREFLGSKQLKRPGIFEPS
jgi:hypothetical protein